MFACVCGSVSKECLNKLLRNANIYYDGIAHVRYGVGYHLTLVKKENCNQNAVTSLIMNYVPDAQLLSSVGAEMEFVLSSEHSSGFETLFQEIESKFKQHQLERVT